MTTETEISLAKRTKNTIREVANFPKPGINFKDISPLLSDIQLFNELIEYYAHKYKNQNIDYIAGIESRGFIFGAALAAEMNAGFVPIRKPGKLPAATISESYELEYGNDALEIHLDAFNNKEEVNVILIDDLLATGGTALAASNLIKKLKANIVSFISIIELSFLNARAKLESSDIQIDSLITYN